MRQLLKNVQATDGRLHIFYSNIRERDSKTVPFTLSLPGLPAFIAVFLFCNRSFSSNRFDKREYTHLESKKEPCNHCGYRVSVWR